MPPAWRSPLAVMMRGPTTAITTMNRAQRERGSVFTDDGVARERASAMQDLLEHVVHGDDAEDLAVPLDRQREEVVLGGELCHLAGPVVRIERGRVLVHDRVHRRLGYRQQE